MHFRHIGAPEDKGVRIFQIIVTAHRLIYAKGTHKTRNGRGHAMPGIGIQVIREETRLKEL